MEMAPLFSPTSLSRTRNAPKVLPKRTSQLQFGHVPHCLLSLTRPLAIDKMKTWASMSRPQISTNSSLSLRSRIVSRTAPQCRYQMLKTLQSLSENALGIMAQAGSGSTRCQKFKPQMEVLFRQPDPPRYNGSDNRRKFWQQNWGFAQNQTERDPPASIPSRTLSCAEPERVSPVL